MELNRNLIKTFRKIAKGLSCSEKRLFIAEITRTYLAGNVRKAECSCKTSDEILEELINKLSLLIKP